ncbi:sigma-70 family RNA polymerase sigma factor [Paracoccus sp. CPCC 101403]|uniref:Sigma-70 family RNA polymerase sigma factor n=1 Tax=Paracoccus broussonetiae TaxID=3075834 RepID=A0ABU3EFA2_9RHOB|nr:sigma-70 family RNA polymerase sigma factor [Paracoccus sp. CPCC 101403]MDT1062926.1 sigma-70 family RNA polymerase sigma factor [Paracoccus sp. CPCC 101403]
MTDARRIALEGLIMRVAQGDRSAFDALYDATSAKLHAVCLSLLKDRPEAEETLQEVYLNIWRGASRYSANGLSPMTWLITIARNRAIDRLRARDSRPAFAPAEAAASIPALGASPEQAAIRGQQHSLLAACLDELEPGQAGVVRAVYLEGLTYADLAERQGVPLNTLRSWLRRGLLRLKECVNR